MNQNYCSSAELDQVMMAMASHNLKKVVTALDDVLNTYLQEVNNKFIHTIEAQYIADRLIDMRHADRNMLMCVDEILAALDKTNPVVGQLMEFMQLVDEIHHVAPGLVPYAAANGEYAGKLPDSPPSLWHM